MKIISKIGLGIIGVAGVIAGWFLEEYRQKKKVDVIEKKLEAEDDTPTTVTTNDAENDKPAEECVSSTTSESNVPMDKFKDRLMTKLWDDGTIPDAIRRTLDYSRMDNKFKYRRKVLNQLKKKIESAPAGQTVNPVTEKIINAFLETSYCDLCDSFEKIIYAELVEGQNIVYSGTEPGIKIFTFDNGKKIVTGIGAMVDADSMNAPAKMPFLTLRHISIHEATLSFSWFVEPGKPIEKSIYEAIDEVFRFIYDMMFNNTKALKEHLFMTESDNTSAEFSEKEDDEDEK